MNFKVKDNVFKGECYQHYNGSTVKLEEKDKKPIIGRSGKTKAYATMAGGRLYLSDEQVEAVQDYMHKDVTDFEQW